MLKTHALLRSLTSKLSTARLPPTAAIPLDHRRPALKACVTMPRMISSEIGSQYIGQLGQAGWHQGDYISGGMTAVRTDENNCQRVLNIFPSDYPPGETESDIVVLWFALDRTPRCNQAQPG
jgi:hypothetical protein